MNKRILNIIISMLCALISSVAFVSIIVLIGLIVDDIFGISNIVEGIKLVKPNIHEMLLNNEKFIYLIICIIAYVVFYILLNYNTLKLSLCISYELRMKQFKKIQVLNTFDIAKITSSGFVQRLATDSENVFGGYLAILSTGLFGSFLIIETIIIMFFINPLLALIVVGLTPLSLFVSLFLNKKIRESYKTNTAQLDKLNKISIEYFKNIKLYKSLDYEKDDLEKFKKINDRLYETNLRSQWFGALINPSVRFVNNIVYLTVGLVGLYLMYLGNITTGVLVMFLLFSNQYTKPFNDVSAIIGDIQQAFASHGRVKNIFELDEVIDGYDEKEELKGEFKFNDVSFGYDEIKVLKNLDFSIKKGEHIALVGPTGCGKTTIVNMIMKFLTLNEGVLYIDDKDYLLYKTNFIRANIVMVLQDGFIFSKSYLDNIIYGNKLVDKEKLNKILVSTGIDKIVEKLDRGLDTIIVNPHTLSVGERQLICIARALVNEKSIVVLDEATSSIDIATEKKIQNIFLELMNNKTTIVIAHRLSTIKDMDRIIVMNNGEIVEIGKHVELIDKKGFYYKLYNQIVE